MALETSVAEAPSRRFQEWRPSGMWEREPPGLAAGFIDETARSVLFDRHRMTGGTRMVTIEHAILNWADNIVKDRVLHTKFQGNTATFALGVSKQDLRHGWRLGTGLHPYGDGVAIDASKLKPDVVIRGPVMLATADEPANWGLFLLQCLPAALRFVRDRKRFGKFLCHAPPGNRRDLLRVAGIRDEDFINHEVSATYGLEEVRFFQYGFRDLAVTPEDRALFLSLAEKIRWDHKVRKAPKLFLSRKMRTAEQGVYRILRNELELRHALEKAGFDSIETEYMGPIDQIRAMAGAEIIVGLGGAGMFNAVFCPAETRLLDIESTSRFTNAHTNIFASCGMTYGVLVGKQIPDETRTDHHDWEVDVKEVLRSLDKIMTHARPQPSRVVCRVDRMEKGHVSGWAHNPAVPGESLKLAVYVDGARVNVLVDHLEVDHVTCSRSRPDVLAAKMGPEKCGYAFMFTKPALDGFHHVFEFRTIDGRPVKLRFGDGDYDHRMFSHLWQPRLLSSVEYVEGGVVRGWVLAADLESGLFVGTQRVSLVWNGRSLGSTVADGLLTEGSDDRAVGMTCAFSFDLPQWLLLESRPLLRVFVEPQDAELEGSPLKPIGHGDEQRRAALDLYETLTRLQDEVVASAAIVRNIALARYPRAAFARWDGEVSALLSEQTTRLATGSASAQRLTVFIIIRDADIARLQATLDSVANQNSQTFQVCLVLAAGDATARQLSDIAKSQAQVVSSVLDRRDRAISWVELATLPPASGEGWCMFLDSGDVLRPYAWSVLQAHVDDASMLLYFDDVDTRSNPRLKPGWNRTLLQDGDIIGRSVAVRAAVAGRLAKKANESARPPVSNLLALTPDSCIRHVAAVLATITVNEPQPVAEARSDEYPMIEEADDRSQSIALTRQPEVCILFIDEWDPGEFRRCVDLIIAQVDYPAYEIVVSCSDIHFAEIRKQPLVLPDGVRLRNITVDSILDTARRLSKCLETVQAEFVVLLSGQILRPKAQWLRALVRECLSDPKVAAVGGKNLSADGTLKDAGFIKTADGGLAAVGEGVAGRAPGYLGRFSRVQEVSSLAGPAVLFRRSALLDVVYLGSGQASIATMLPQACMGIVERGHKVVWAPDAIATCIDLATPATPEMFKSALTVGRIGVQPADPFYNPNFSAEQPLFSQLKPPSDAVASLLPSPAQASTIKPLA